MSDEQHYKVKLAGFPKLDPAKIQVIIQLALQIFSLFSDKAPMAGSVPGAECTCEVEAVDG